MPRYHELYDAILTGNEKAAIAHTRQALDSGTDPQAVVKEAMIAAMDEAGKRFEAQEMFVIELLISARAMKAALAIVRPFLAETGAESAGRVVLGTVQGDLHDIGKSLVGSMLEGAGFEVIDLGADVSPENFVEAIKESDAPILCLSALLTTTMLAMKSTLDALKRAGIRDQLKVIVGGAPVSQNFADEIGADAYGENARSAVTLVRNLVG
jgi:corrinoid protein of di/trimethylamine methyltransferase